MHRSNLLSSVVSEFVITICAHPRRRHRRRSRLRLRKDDSAVANVLLFIARFVEYQPQLLVSSSKKKDYYTSTLSFTAVLGNRFAIQVIDSWCGKTESWCQSGSLLRSPEHERREISLIAQWLLFLFVQLKNSRNLKLVRMRPLQMVGHRYFAPIPRAKKNINKRRKKANDD